MRWNHRVTRIYNPRRSRDFRRSLAELPEPSRDRAVGADQLMTYFSRRTCSALLCTLIALAPFASAQVCGAPAVPAPLLPVATMPAASPLTVHVDPESGDDTLASPGGAPYKTIAAAIADVAIGRGAAQLGEVVLLPGWYGFDPADPRYNGETWPVVVPPGIHLQGVNALNVMLDGGRKAPGATTWSVPSTGQAGFADVVPCLVLGGSHQGGYDHSLVNRLTIVDADVGVLVIGDGEVHPTIAETLFMNCGVGAQVHSTGAATQGVHRPRFLWNTFGNCDVGCALTAEVFGTVAPVRAYPALVNCLFKNVVDLEGVPCHAMASCAFGATRANLSTFVPQPATAELPTTLFDVDGFSHADLFIGARASIAGQQNVGLPHGDWWFTDWRLTFTTELPGAIANPADGSGVTVFPSSTPNGTAVDVGFGPGVNLGPVSSEGPGTYGPLNGPFGGATGHIGYRSGGTFLVGGTVPGERRFGPDAAGIMYDLIEIHWKPGQNPFVAGVVHPWVPRLWLSGQDHAEGVLANGVSASFLFGPAFVGDVFLDLWSYPQDVAVSMLLTTTLASAGASGYAQINLSSFGAPPSFPKFGGVWQVALLDQTNAFIASDAQAFYVGQ